MLEPVVLRATESEMPIEIPVRVFDNHISFYDDIMPKQIESLIYELRTLDKNDRADNHNYEPAKKFPPAPVYLHLHSYGGFVHSGFAIADIIKHIKTPVYCVAEGMVASAATLPLMACERRFAYPHTYFLIHQLKSIAWGKFSDLEDEMKLCNDMMEHMIEFYINHSSMDRNQVKDLLNRESWLTAQQALELGIIDEILE